MKILVIGGGNGSEREVSLRSSAAVRDGLTDLGHAVTWIDAKEPDEVVLNAAREAELVFPILHGTGGEDGTIQRLLDQASKPYLGSNAAVSELCFNKNHLKALVAEHGVVVPRGEVVDAAGFAASPLILAPFVLKPIADGSTVGCLIARTLPFDQSAADALFKTYGHMLLEELVVGPEITVPILDATATPVIEIVPPEGAEFDYENKYNGATAELCPPKNIPQDAQKRAQKLAEQVHQLAGCRHLSRVDMILRPDGQLVVLEINTMPGMTAQSLYPKGARAAGYSWSELMQRFVEMLQDSKPQS